jgi:hypothetical protein
LENLTSLNFHECKSLRDIEPLAGLQNLTWLNLGWCEFIENVRLISRLNKLTALSLNGCKALRSADIFLPLRDISQLSLVSCPNFEDASALGMLTSLTTLLMDGSTSIREQGDYSQLQYLTKFTHSNPDVPLAILPVSAMRRGDSEFVKGNVESWVQHALKSAKPQKIVPGLARAISLGSGESWSRLAHQKLINGLFEKGVVDKEMWKVLLEECHNHNDAIAIQIHEELMDKIDFSTQAPSFIEAVFYSISKFKDENQAWGTHKVDTLLKKIPLRKLRRFGSIICQFYYNVSRPDRVNRWKSKLGTKEEDGEE